MVEKYHDAMTICRTYGNPTLFITMTTNSNQPEVKEHLATYGGTSTNERPDIECRVFKMNLKNCYQISKKAHSLAHLFLVR